MKLPQKSNRGLIAAAAAAIVTVTAAGFVLVDHTPTTSVKKITGTTAQTPGLAWSLDPAEYLGSPSAVFSDPRWGASYNSGIPGFVIGGNTVVTLAGVPNDSGYALDQAVMIGVDAGNGTVRWKAPADDVEQCGGEPLDGKIYCYAMGDEYALVTYDIESGASARRSIEQAPFGLTTTSDALYLVEGSPEENDVRVHSGTFDDISADWSRSFDIGASWEEAFGPDIVTTSDGVGLVQTGGEMAQFNTSSGAELWSIGDDCALDVALHAGGVVVQSNTDCEAYDTVVEQLLRGPDGRVLATTESPTVQTPLLEDTSDTDAPILIGDAAYDRTTGDRLWTSTDLVGTGQEGRYGTVTAIVDDIVYLRDLDSETGLDLRTGKRLWHNTAVTSFTPSAVDGTVLLGEDGITLTAFDVKTGRVVWTAPFIAIDSDPEAFSAAGATERHGDGWIHSSARRMIGLTPLPQ